MKTSVKHLAAATLFALLIMVGNTNARAAKVETIAPETETIFEIENWMIDENIWELEPIIELEIVEEADLELELEDWMISDEIWDNIELIVEEKETDLIVEDWMVSEQIWDVEKQK